MTKQYGFITRNRKEGPTWEFRPDPINKALVFPLEPNQAVAAPPVLAVAWKTKGSDVREFGFVPLYDATSPTLQVIRPGRTEPEPITISDLSAIEFLTAALVDLPPATVDFITGTLLSEMLPNAVPDQAVGHSHGTPPSAVDYDLYLCVASHPLELTDLTATR